MKQAETLITKGINICITEGRISMSEAQVMPDWFEYRRTGINVDEIRVNGYTSAAYC
jgi:hypothetical protein